jgi:hypothetical protein
MTKEHGASALTANAIQISSGHVESTCGSASRTLQQVKE